MDGTMFVHHPRTKEVVKSIPSPTRVHFNFEFLGGRDFHLNDIRTKMDGDFMGCIGDLGWYCARMGLLVFSGSYAGLLNGLVTHVQVTRHQLNDQGVPVDAECIVYFKEVRHFVPSIRPFRVAPRGKSRSLCLFTAADIRMCCLSMLSLAFPHPICTRSDSDI